MADEGLVSGRPIRGASGDSDTLTAGQPRTPQVSDPFATQRGCIRRLRDQHRHCVIGERLPGICAYNDSERHAVHCRPNQAHL